MLANFCDVLDRCTREVGLEFDPLVAKGALHRAEYLLPGSLKTIWLDRLEEAGRALGLRVTGTRGTVRGAIAAASRGMPVVAYVPDPQGEDEDAGRWLVLLSHRGRSALVAGGDGDLDRWVGPHELARLRGLDDVRRPAEWALVQPIAPCAGMRDPAAEEDESPDRDQGPSPGAPSPWWRLIGMMRPEARDIRVVVAFAVGVGILSLATPLTVEALVTTVALNLLVQQLVVLSLILLICLSFAAAMLALQYYVLEVIQRRLFARVASDLAYRLPRVAGGAYGHSYGPELVNRFFEVLTVQKVLALLLMDGIAIVLQSITGLLVLAFYHPYLLGFDLAVLMAMTIAVFLLGRGAIRTSIQESRAKYVVASRLEEMARAAEAYKLGDPSFAMDRVDGPTRGYLMARRRHFAIVMRQVVFALGFQAVASSSLMGLGGWLVIQGQLTLGQLVAAELIVSMVVGSFAKLGKNLENFYDLMAAVEKLGLLVDLPLERHDGDLGRDEGISGRPALRLHRVSFSYDGHRDVLHDLELDLAPGERVAVIGTTGAGKTTLVDLLFGLRTPASGRIELNGVNLRDLPLETVRERVAVVKEAAVIEGTVVDNVRMGRFGISLSEVIAALEMVGLYEGLAELTDGLHTWISAAGAPLSRGQVLRLSLARAIAGRPALLVLDETLDALDLDARAKVTDSLFDRSAPWTLLIITHSQDIADRCDRAIALRPDGAPRPVPRSNSHAAHLEDWLREDRS